MLRKSRGSEHKNRGQNDARKEPQAKECMWLLGGEEDKEMNFPLRVSRETSLADKLTSAQ